jgi:hypothetical protein
LAALSPIGDACAQSVIRVPPAEHRPKLVDAKSAATMLVPADKARRIVLGAPTAVERAALKSDGSADARSGRPRAGKDTPLVIGFPRTVPATARTIPLRNLQWVGLPDGARAARIEIAAPGAAALRVALALPHADPDLAVVFKGSGLRAQAIGPLPANAIAEATERHGMFWTPVLEGDNAIIELHAAPGVSLERLAITLGPVSHLVVAGEALARASPDRVSDIGGAAACNIDVACVTPTPALTQAAQSLGKLVVNDRAGVVRLCSTVLMNDDASSMTPYVLTASHCVERDPAFMAATANVYWFFRAQTCGARVPPPYALQSGGAMVLARSEDFDWALLRLNRAPPFGTVFAAWAVEPVAAGVVGIGLHHPRGDLAKLSQGATTGYRTFSDGSSFIGVQWSQGTTEIGSSGSGLFTFAEGQGHYELRGGLFAGEASCTNPGGVDYYSRLDNMLPLVRQYLTPSAPNPEGKAVAVEFYHRALDRFFITTDSNEINVLDTGALAGWERTGLRFLAYNAPAPGTRPVCRFHLTPAAGSSHFYSGDPAECEAVKARFGAAWILESANVFHIALPDPATGACPADTQPVWRFLNATDPNHRYTTDVQVRDRLRSDPRWIGEGYGADQVIMCAPTG